MRACTIISKHFKSSPLTLLFALSLLTCSAHAQNPPPAIPPGQGAQGESPNSIPPKKEESNLFDSASPYLDYADFNMNEEENEDTLYFQYGRYFGVSLGLGYQTATGNRGKHYQAALPRVDARIQYWFGFHFAGDLGIFFANHSFSDGSLNTDVKLIGYGFHLKYYFDVKDSAAPISFANPFFMAGVGAMSKSQTTATSTEADSDSTMSVDFGGGFEFPVVYKKTYLSLEALYHTQSFIDTRETKYSAIVPNLEGGFFTLLAHFMFVW